MSEYLKFQEVSKPKRKTKFVRVLSKDGETLLGEISFWPAWRKYVFNPAWSTMFDNKCLLEIISKLDEMNNEIRAEWKSRRLED